MNKQIITNIIIAVSVGALAFIGGLKYAEMNPAKISPSEYMQFNRRNGGSTQMRQGQSQGMRPVRGEVIESDGSTVTVKSVDGSSKIVILSDKTEISKSTAGSASDIKKGETITVFGKEDSGTITAQTVAIGTGGFMQRNGSQQVPESGAPKPSQGQTN